MLPLKQGCRGVGVWGFMEIVEGGMGKKELGKVPTPPHKMKFYRTPHHFSSYNTALPPTLPPYMGHPPP